MRSVYKYRTLPPGGCSASLATVLDKGRKVDKGGGSSGGLAVGGLQRSHQVDDQVSDQVDPVTKFDPVSLIHTQPPNIVKQPGS